jgi:hypothetical protein
VVRDASSHNDQLSASISGNPDADSQDRQAPPSNLTHELARLLAASIAQNQASRGRGGVPTNSELTNLANLVSAVSGQRTLAPVFKDGLSALAYTQAKPAPAREPAAAPQLELAHDDEPMPIPSTWRQPAAHDDERWFRQQMGAAVLGLIAGLMIVVPAVLWLRGWFDPQEAKPNAAGRMTAAISAPLPEAKTLPVPKTSEVKTVKAPVRPVEKPSEGAAQFVTGSIDARPEAQAPQLLEPPTPAIAAARLIDPKTHLDELVAKAALRIESGDIVGARELLAGAELGAYGPGLFALAETYDPNKLASLGTRDVVADAVKARGLYRKALNLGVARAQERLDALN